MFRYLFFMFILLIGLSVQAHEFITYEHGVRHVCTPEPESVPVTCVPNCMQRRENGDCFQYKADFCGKNPTCVPNCYQRRDNGECFQYHSDVCSEG